MLSRTRWTAILGGSVWLLTACSGDSITETTGDALARDEASAVLAAVSEILAGALPGLSTAPPLAAIPLSERFGIVQSCPLGGTVSLAGTISGDVEPDGESGDFNLDFTEDIDHCVVSHQTTRFVVNGDPDLRFGGRLSIRITGSSSTEWNGTLELRGGFAYTASDGRSGSCGIAVTYRYAGTSVSYTRTVCGRPTSGTITTGF